MKNLTFYEWPVDPKLAEIWRRCFQSFTWASGTFVCSNHFPLGRTPENRKTDYPSIFITLSDYLQKSRPRKGKRTSYKKLVPQDACPPVLKFVMMIVRKMMKNWKQVRTSPSQSLCSLNS